MAISRLDMERQLRKDGGILTIEDAQRMAPPGESLAYINADEAALLKSLGGAGKDIAGAVFQAAQKPKDPIALKISQAGRDAKANPHVVAGAEGIQASNKELMGQLAGKLKPKKLLKKKKKK